MRRLTSHENTGFAKRLRFEGRSQAFESAPSHRDVAQLPRFPQHRLHALLQPIREVSQDISLFVKLTPVDDTE